jgi:hypothetical protein
VAATGISTVTADVVAVLAASLVNFAASDRIVFVRREPGRALA